MESTQGEGTRPIPVVLFVGRDGFDRFGPIVRHLAVGLIDQPVQLRIASFDARVEALKLGPVRAVPFREIRRPWTQRRSQELIEMLADPSPVVIHALSADVHAAATLAATALDAELVLQVNTRDDCDAVQRLVQHRDTHFVVTGEQLGVILEQQCKITGECIHLVRPGVLAAETIGCLQQPGNTPSLLCTSALERGHGVDVLLSAVTLLQGKGTGGQSVHTFLLGGGRMESSLRRRVRELGLSADVTFAHPSGGLERTMHSADVFVLPARADAFHADSLQAMGAGMAVVAVADPICDHLLDGETALICESPTARGISTALARLLTDHDFARRLAEGGLAHVRTNHAMSKMAQEVAAVYRKLAIKRTTFPIAE